jgi:succinyl-diaminopimelate desuccinylase
MPDGLLGLATALVGIPSVSHHETQVADAVESALRLCPWLTVERVGDNVIARTHLGRNSRLLLAGHLDTVPPVNGNDEPHLDDEVLHGVGSVDMKGGLAVFLHLAGTIPEPVVDTTWCFYVCEEVEQRFNGLRALFEQRPELLAADAAILGEPTGGVVEAGCQGTLRVRVSLAGSRAHTARPWTGRNAIHRLAPVLASVAAYESRRPIIDGCEFGEQLQIVEINGGVAGNVVPDSASVLINYRFAPDRSIEQATESVRSMLEGHLEAGDRFELVESAPGAPPSLGHPLLSALVAATDEPPRAKVGWTDVASLWAEGVPAANFGPGDPSLAHTSGEHVARVELEHASSVLGALLRGDR